MNVYFVSLGCDKNTVDTEMMLGILDDAGHTITYDETQADVVIINTCAFICDAKEESINTILEMAELKKTARLKYLVVAGCLGQRYSEEIIEQIPEVDAILGIQAFDKVADVLNELEDGSKKYIIPDINGAPLCGFKRLQTTASHYAYMKIAEGCNKRCTYCIIPKMRGNYRSVPMETLLEEARTLADRGVSELILVAQETTIYGIDIYGEKSLPKLLTNLAQIEGIQKIRLLYCYPEEITDELIDVMRDEPKICHYLDMPIQHASDSILKRMGRKTTQEDLRVLIDKLRNRIPDIALRTTLISGFPGETRADHKALVSFVRDMRFDRLGVFTYSPEDGTAAATMSHQRPEWIKRHRRNEIMKVQRKIAFDNAKAAIGSEYDATIEGRLVEDGVYVARTYKDAPGVDGYVFVTSERDLMSGDVIRVRITGARGYDLVAEEL